MGGGWIWQTAKSTDLPLQPSIADRIDHGFATISNFFPGTKMLASELMEALVRQVDRAGGCDQGGYWSSTTNTSAPAGNSTN